MHSVSNLDLTSQNLGQTNLSVQLQLLSHGRAAEVGVNEDDGRTCISHCASQRQRHSRLTFTGHCRGDDERTRGSVNVHEAQVGAQLTDRLLRDVVVGVAVNDVVFVQVVTDGQNAQDACAGCLGSVVTSTDALIQCAAQENRQVHQTQTSNSADEHVLLVVRSYQRRVHACVVQRNHANGVVGGRGCGGVFAVHQCLSVTGVLLNFLDVVGGSLQRTVSEQLCVLRGRSLRAHGNQCSVVTSGCGEARANLTGAHGQLGVVLLNLLCHGLRGDDSSVGASTLLSGRRTRENIHRTGLAHGHVARGRCSVDLRLKRGIAEARCGTDNDANDQQPEVSPRGAEKFQNGHGSENTPESLS